MTTLKNSMIKLILIEDKTATMVKTNLISMISTTKMINSERRKIKKLT